jgi:hypothetical protein
MNILQLLAVILGILTGLLSLIHFIYDYIKDERLLKLRDECQNAFFSLKIGDQVEIKYLHNKSHISVVTSINGNTINLLNGVHLSYISIQYLTYHTSDTSIYLINDVAKFMVYSIKVIK